MGLEIKNNANTTKSAIANEIEMQRKARSKGEIIVPKGLTLSQLARKFNISVDELKKMTGLKSSTLNVGQVIKGLPTDTAKAGKGIVSIAREHGMTLQAFCDLNGIKKDYQPKSGEAFYVYPSKNKKAEKLSKPVKTNQNIAPNPKQTVKEDKATPKSHTSNALSENEKYAASINTSSDIANALKNSANLTAAVGKDKFNIPFNKINKENVVNVINEYNKISPKESLIEMISDEWGSSKQNRMQAITTLYDTLAKNVGSNVATPTNRDAFMQEMQKQYDSWGMVSTKKMDKMINELIQAKSTTQNKTDNNSANPTKLSGNKTRIMLGNGTTKTSEQLKKEADDVALKNSRPVKRPEPVVDANGNIVAKVDMLNPTGKGPLNGKTIIINSGHGGYNPKNGSFDPGTYSVDKNGKYIEEWYKNKNFTDEIIPQLRAKGAKVIFMSGSAASIMKAKEKYKNADMFISIHCDSAENAPAKRGQTIIFRDSGSQKLANTIESKIETHEWLNKDTCKSSQDKRGLGVLRAAANVPSILIETGYQSNPDDLANIDSGKFRKEFAELITQGVIDYVSQK